MSCSPFDLTDYFFEELAAPEARQVESHLSGCAGCQEELARLRLTAMTLGSVRDEEPPRRIAFVSDKVFEPKWWQFWNYAPKSVFASACLLSAALLVHTFTRPAVAIPSAELQTRVEAEVSRRLAVVPAAAVQQPAQAPAAATLEAVVSKAVAQAREEDRQQAVRLVKAAEERVELQRREDRMAFEQDVDYLRRQVGVWKRASLEAGGLR